jgi:hypothetical protein
MHVLHHCDQRWCCNPDHLFLGTNQDNVDDCIVKGRWNTADNAPKGEESYFAKLTEDSVRYIRSSNDKLKILAVRFGVTETLVSMVRRRKVWKHVV